MFYRRYQLFILTTLGFLAAVLAGLLISCTAQKKFNTATNTAPSFKVISGFNTTSSNPSNSLSNFQVQVLVSNARVGLSNGSSCIRAGDTTFGILSANDAVRYLSNGVTTLQFQPAPLAQNSPVPTSFSNCKLLWQFADTTTPNVFKSVPLGDFWFDDTTPSLIVNPASRTLLPNQLANSGNTFSFKSNKYVSFSTVGAANCINANGITTLQPNIWSPSVAINAQALNNPSNGGVTTCTAKVFDKAGNTNTANFQITTRLPNFTIDISPKSTDYPTKASAVYTAETGGKISCQTDDGTLCFASPKSVTPGAGTLVLDNETVGISNYTFTFTPDGISTAGSGWDVVVVVRDITYKANFGFHIYPLTGIHGKMLPIQIDSSAGGLLNFTALGGNLCPYTSGIQVPQNAVGFSATPVDPYAISGYSDRRTDHTIDCYLSLTIQQPLDASGATLRLGRVNYTYDRTTPGTSDASPAITVNINKASHYTYTFHTSEPVFITGDTCNAANVNTASASSTLNLTYNFITGSTNCTINFRDQVPEVGLVSSLYPNHTGQTGFTANLLTPNVAYTGDDYFYMTSGSTTFSSDTAGKLYCSGPVTAGGSLTLGSCGVAILGAVTSNTFALTNLTAGDNTYRFTFVPIPPNTAGDTTSPWGVSFTHPIHAENNPLTFALTPGFTIPKPINTGGTPIAALKLTASIGGTLTVTGNSGGQCPTLSTLNMASGDNTIPITWPSATFPSGVDTKINCNLKLTASGPSGQTATLNINNTNFDLLAPTLSASNQTVPWDQVGNYTYYFNSVSEDGKITIDNNNCTGGSDGGDIPITKLGLSIGLQLVPDSGTAPAATSWKTNCTFTITDLATNSYTNPSATVFTVTKPTVSLTDAGAPSYTSSTSVVQVNFTAQVGGANAPGVMDCLKADNTSCGTTTLQAGALSQRISLTNLDSGTNSYTLRLLPPATVTPDLLRQLYKVDTAISVNFNNSTTVQFIGFPTNGTTVGSLNLNTLYIKANRNGYISSAGLTPGATGSVAFASFPTQTSQTYTKNINNPLAVTLPSSCGTGKTCTIDETVVFTETETGTNGTTSIQITFTLNQSGLSLAANNAFNPPKGQVIDSAANAFTVTFSDTIALSATVTSPITLQSSTGTTLYSFNNNSDVVVTSGSNVLTLNLPSSSTALLGAGHVFINIPSGKITSSSLATNTFSGLAVSANNCASMSNCLDYYPALSIQTAQTQGSWTLLPAAGGRTTNPSVSPTITCSSPTNDNYCIDPSSTSSSSRVSFNSASDTAYISSLTSGSNQAIFTLDRQLTSGNAYGLNYTVTPTLPMDYSSFSGTYSTLKTKKGVILYNKSGNQDLSTNWSFTYTDTGVLNTITTKPAMAYSLRRLDTAYTGNAIQVVALPKTGYSKSYLSADNSRYAHQDIGFDSAGNLDTASLSSFSSTNSSSYIAVSIWYDQSGNGRNLTQYKYSDDSGNYEPLPIIGNTSSSYYTQSGKPSIYFPHQNDGNYPNNHNGMLWNGTGVTNVLGSDSGTSNPISYYKATAMVVMTPYDNNGFAFGWVSNNNSAWAAQFNYCNGQQSQFGMIFSAYSKVQATCFYGNSGSSNYYAILTDNDQAYFYSAPWGTNPTPSSQQNGISRGNNSISVYSYDFTVGYPANYNRIGSSGVSNSNNYGSRYYSELILYGSALSSSDWQAISYNQARYYGFH